jgi:hypothetical protein
VHRWVSANSSSGQLHSLPARYGRIRRYMQQLPKLEPVAGDPCGQLEPHGVRVRRE